jgi:Co/Zn/Cd efflux system component
MYEKYPFWIVVVSNLLSLAVYLLGAMILFRVSTVALAIHLLYVAWLVLRLIRGHCVDCYYFGKMCFCGRGKISCLFFKKGDPQKFARMQVTWKSLIADMLVSLVPILAGIVLLFREFDWLLLVMIFLLFLLSSAGNGFVRTTLACRSCKQREAGCPADRFFNKGHSPLVSEKRVE